MRLRNKKTGEIWEIPKERSPAVQQDDISFWAHKGLEGHLFSYKSIAELNEEWEDYAPAEPLIKDEKIRKAVRAWAEATGTRSVNYWGDIESQQRDAKISFDSGLGINHGDDYTIAELCGEEEE